mmetsp:Transcript_41872/g.98144  ORF Transcript_41872/g.98144 Transcript_41872/m.98144 type:complete len:103 (-) Transcript_41872:381-689(-)
MGRALRRRRRRPLRVGGGESPVAGIAGAVSERSREEEDEGDDGPELPLRTKADHMLGHSDSGGDRERSPATTNDEEKKQLRRDDGDRRLLFYFSLFGVVGTS